MVICPGKSYRAPKNITNLEIKVDVGDLKKTPPPATRQTIACIPNAWFSRTRPSHSANGLLRSHDEQRESCHERRSRLENTEPTPSCGWSRGRQRFYESREQNFSYAPADVASVLLWGYQVFSDDDMTNVEDQQKLISGSEPHRLESRPPALAGAPFLTLRLC